MSGWATFWWLIGLILLICAIASVIFFNPFVFASLLFSSFAFFTVGRLLRCVTNILENQKKILKAVSPGETFVDE